MTTNARQSLIPVLFIIILALSAPAAQPHEIVLKVVGEVEQPLSLKLADLRSMPRTTLKAREKNQEDATFEGVLLVEIINRAKPRLSEKCCNNVANTCLIIHAADKYRAIFALPEMDANFSDRKILVADLRDGKSLAESQGPLKLIVPDEKTHARWVRQVETIEVFRVSGAKP